MENKYLHLYGRVYSCRMLYFTAARCRLCMSRAGLEASRWAPQEPRPAWSLLLSRGRVKINLSSVKVRKDSDLRRR